ncbi:MAG: hypothetical protein H0U73_12620 [Tatlockia sp.]|nr:hypothetical protein [Tatlockia sp.]
MHTQNHSFYNHDLSFYEECLAILFRSPKASNSYGIGDWIVVNAHELQEKIGNNCPRYREEAYGVVRTTLIELIIHKINHGSYGAGQVYELYEERRQETLENVFAQVLLVDDEISHIKKQCDYVEGYIPYLDKCKDCGIGISASEYAQSLSFLGKECCSDCLPEYY